jgi:two-component system, cell cycle sensor histidine kinase PleC
VFPALRLGELFRSWPLFKSFAVLSGPLLLGAGFLIAMMNHVWYVEGIERAAERNNVALTRILSNVVLPKFRDQALAQDDPNAQSYDTPWRRDMTHEIAAVVRTTSIVKIKLYRADGVTAFSTDRSEIGEVEDDNAGFRAAIAGTVMSEMEFEDEINAFDKVIYDRNTVSSYIPIFDTTNPTRVVAVFEIYDDITLLLEQFREAEIRTGLFVGALFLAIYACLVTVVRHSEREARRLSRKGKRLADEAARADAASTAKSEFLANMSHELRTPLNAIVGFSEVMKDGLLGPVTPKPYAEYVGHIWSAASHLTDIIGSILDLSKIDAGKVTVEQNAVVLSDTVALVTRMMQAKAAERSITLSNALGANLGTMTTDAVKLRQILLNLLSNAIKFTPQSGRVTLRVERTGGDITFLIEDTGIGMDENEIKIAMSPFGQVESPFSRHHEGTGLGLPLTQRLVILLGGTLSLRSQKGIGTLAKVVLPGARTAAPRMQAS